MSYKQLIKGAVLDKDRIDLYKKPKYRLFKTLYSDACRMDCKYCPFSRHCNYPRASWREDELVRVFLDAYKSRRVNGLFLSSSLFTDPETVVEKELSIVEILRKRDYRGYIHLRLMPGTPKDLLFHAAVLADRAGINIEAPRHVFHEIAPSKGDWLNDIIKRIEWLAWLKKKFRREQRRGPGYLSSGIDTQIMLGVLDETDLEVLETVWRLLQIGVDRIYISGFRPYKQTPLEAKNPVNHHRYLRVVKAVELMRAYGFTLDEIKTIIDENGMLMPGDPKVLYANVNKHLYPVNINIDPYERLIRVPGIGPRTAKKILALRQEKKLKQEDLIRMMGWRRYKQARNFIVY